MHQNTRCQKCLLLCSLIDHVFFFLFEAIDCMVSEWSEWSECNKSCGKGHTIRTRMVKLEPQFGGRACPETIQRKKCKLRKCPGKRKETRGVSARHLQTHGQHHLSINSKERHLQKTLTRHVKYASNHTSSKIT